MAACFARVCNVCSGSDELITATHPSPAGPDCDGTAAAAAAASFSSPWCEASALGSPQQQPGQQQPTCSWQRGSISVGPYQERDRLTAAQQCPAAQ
jgi:hypothetical protein